MPSRPPQQHPTSITTTAFFVVAVSFGGWRSSRVRPTNSPRHLSSQSKWNSPPNLVRILKSPVSVQTSGESAAHPPTPDLSLARQSTPPCDLQTKDRFYGSLFRNRRGNEWHQNLGHSRGGTNSGLGHSHLPPLEPQAGLV